MTVTLDMIGPPLHFLNAYAPQSGTETRLKNDFYETLERNLVSFPNSHPTFIVGDFNARLHARFENEACCIGQHIFGRGLNFLIHNSSPASFENRSLFVEFCLAHDLHIGNTLFQKPVSKQVTFREAGVLGGPPWSPDRFAQIDFVLVPDRWKNTLVDVSSSPEIFTESDHFIVCAKCRVRRKQLSSTVVKKITYSPPTPLEKASYNQFISDTLRQASDAEAKTFLDSIRKAARVNLRPTPLGRRRSYISEHTWDLILQRQREHDNGNHDILSELTKKIKKEAKNDKKRHILEQLKDTLPSREQWAGIKIIKKKRTPNFTKMKDKDGNRVGPRGRAGAVADYLHAVQWKADILPPSITKRSIIQSDLPYNLDQITMTELDAALRKAKNHKAAGPDGIQAELFKYLDVQNRAALLSVLNGWWSKEAIPSDFLNAQVVSIFKKGDTENIANYRPISLLNAIYKIFAEIIRQRLSDVIDPYICNTQFGFRKNRSTTDALFIARRLQDLGERSGDNIVICMLDWKQAFDRISHPRMMQALERLNLPRKFRNLIASFYTDLSFQVKHENFLSHAKSQDAGIRQGCPLSPFLFILVMTVLFHDIGVEHYRDLSECRLDQISFNEVLYADDTLLISRNTFGMNLLLHAIEDESAYYGLKLNHDKCHVLAMNGHNCIRFKDGSRMKHVEEAVYLGGILTKHVNIASEVSNRIASAMATWKSLDIFWKEAQCSTRNKILIYNAVIQSKLLYALETIEIPVALLSRLESFQLKGLRKILGMTTTYINRANTNEEVFRRANLHIAANHHGTKIEPIQDILAHRRIALAAKVLRQDNDSPMRMVSFKKDTAAPVEVLFRRVGRPRKQWTQNTLTMIWRKIRNDQSDFNNSNAQLAQILQAAINKEI